MNDATDDRLLVKAMCSGDEAAFDRFFRDFAPRIYRFVMPRVDRNGPLAEDLTQEILGRAMQRIAGWRGEASLFTWLCQMARNEISDHWRRTQRRERVEVLAEDDPAVAAALESIEGDSQARPENQRAREDLMRLVQVALDALPGSYGNALEWKYVDGFSVAEIASRLGLNAISTQSMLARARRAFREAFTTLAGTEALDLLPFAIDGHEIEGQGHE
jgi:RNA polymerase sigma-70 factor (ECF subfamily)